jgi:hypothetical protein
VYVPLGALLVLVKYLGRGQHASELIDPHFSPGQSLSHGSLWVVGLVGWAWSCCGCLIGALAARGRASLTPQRRLLAGAGLLTLLMFADDLFQLHKPVIPDATGLPSGLVLAVYAAAFVLWIVANRVAIADTDVLLLIVALAFFALWILTKAAPGIPGRIPLSSGAKLCGIAGWATYLTRAAARTIRAARTLRPSG